MFSKGTKVLIVEGNGPLGEGTISDVCTNDDELKKYFEEKHPLYLKFFLNLINKEVVYIVDFEGQRGRAGYLIKQLRKKT